MPVKSNFRQLADFEEKLRKELLTSHPVITFRQMSPEKQAEMRRLYKKQPRNVKTLKLFPETIPQKLR